MPAIVVSPGVTPEEITSPIGGHFRGPAPVRLELRFRTRGKTQGYEACWAYACRFGLRVEPFACCTSRKASPRLAHGEFAPFGTW
jgi:hypothetical protein